MKERTNKIAICFLAAAALAGTAYIFFNERDNSPNEEDDHEHEMFVELTEAQIESAGIALQTAGPGRLQHAIHTPGKITLNSKRVVHISPTVGGIVKDANKNVGDSVNAGELLAVIDSHEMAEAKSAYLDIFKRERMALANLEREKKLFDKRISSEVDYQTALTESEKAKIELDLAKHKLLAKGLTHSEILQLQEDKNSKLQHYSLRAPMQGIVTYKNLNKGELVDPAREVYIIADLNTVTADLKVYPKDLPYISEGSEIDVHCTNGLKGQGIITSISPTIDEDTYSISVSAILNNENKEWKPGMYVCADIKGQAEQAEIVVPRDAIQKIDNLESLFVVNEHKFEIRPVSIGRSDEKFVEILSGLTPGERYASSNTFLLKAEHGKHEAQHMD